MPASEALLAALRSDALEFLANKTSGKSKVNTAAIIEYAARMMYPLPNLGARNFRRSRILHQVVKRHAAEPAEPGFDILNGHADIQAQAAFGNRARGRFE